MTVHTVVLYDPNLPHGRQVVGDFDSEIAASERANDFPERNVSVLSRQPTRYVPNLHDLHGVSDRTGYADGERPRKTPDGLEFHRLGRLIGFWPTNRRGTGTDGRVMPHDLRQWVADCLWAEANGARLMPRIFGTLG